MVYSDTPAQKTSITNTHIFVGTESKLANVFGARDGSSQTFLECLQDQVCFWGAPNKLVGDAARIYHSWSLLQHLRNIWVPQWQC